MNVVKIEIVSIRPAQNGNKMLGNVSFHISGGIGDRLDVMNFECSCDIPKGKTTDERLFNIKQGLQADALRQAKRMPEFRSGEDQLVILTPREQFAA